MNVNQFDIALDSKYAWPGGYPTYFITSDGACLCHECARKNAALIRDAIPTADQASGWHVDAQDVNWESDIDCDNCNQPIESAYPVVGGEK